MNRSIKTDESLHDRIHLIFFNSVIIRADQIFQKLFKELYRLDIFKIFELFFIRIWGYEVTIVSTDSLNLRCLESETLCQFQKQIHDERRILH